MPKGSVVTMTSGSVTIEFHGKLFQPSPTKGKESSPRAQSKPEGGKGGEQLLHFYNPDARITRVEVDSGGRCGRLSFRVPDERCTIKIFTETPDKKKTP